MDHLSLRAQETGKPSPDPSLWAILSDTWDPATNHTGFVSLGMAENTLMHDDILQHIHGSLSLTSLNLTYGDGSKRLRASLANFLTRKLAPANPIEPAHVTVTNGCSSAGHGDLGAEGETMAETISETASEVELFVSARGKAKAVEQQVAAEARWQGEEVEAWEACMDGVAAAREALSEALSLMRR